MLRAKSYCKASLGLARREDRFICFSQSRCFSTISPKVDFSKVGTV